MPRSSVVDGYEVQAYNTATLSENAMHHDDVAQRYGFRGGLVPGVDVYAYLTHPAAARWGLPWLERGRMRARFLSPVYDGERVRVLGAEAAGGTIDLEVRNEAGDLCATGTASLPDEAPALPDPAGWPAVEPPPRDDRPPPSADSLAAGTALGIEPHTFVVARAGEYLDDVREQLALYREEGVAHPGWLLRDANFVLAGSVRLGPWIHVESDAQHLGLVRDGDRVSCRALVTREWEHKGHRFVELDVLHLAGDRPVMRVTHTAIHTPRARERP
jgi:acyl dehydratase